MSYIGNSPISTAFLTDTFSGNGSTVAFTMSVAPATTSSVLVAVSGVLQDPSTYSVSGTTLTFSAAPPSGTSNISVRYLGIPASGVTTTAYRTVTEFTATASQTTFSVPSYTVGYVDVYRNGVMLGTADFTATNGTTIVLATGATVGDLIRVESFYVSSVLNAIPGTAGSVGTTYLADNSVTTAKIADSNVTTAKIADANVTQAKLASNVASTGPAFIATQSANQTIPNSVNTKIQFNTETLDTNNNYDTTNYRFTPTVAGYYQVNGNAQVQGSSGSFILLSIFKNGSPSGQLTYTANTGVVNPTLSGSLLMYMNGTTDYIELYFTQNSGVSLTLYGTSAGGSNQFSAFLARAA